MKKNIPSASGFSLVEVVLALAIGSFCMVTLLGLIPVGLSNYQQADARNVMVDLATSVAQDLASTPVSSNSSLSPRFSLTVPSVTGAPNMTSPQIVFVDGSGAPLTGNSVANATYRLSVAFAPPLPGTRMATTVHILITFPARADLSTTVPPTKYTTMLQTTVSLNRN